MWASSVMLLDCEKLQHWKTAEQFDELFEMKRDYQPWVGLKLEDADSLGSLEPVWNDFDRLTQDTRMLHTTRRRTQPWKTGLPVDYTVRDKHWGLVPKRWFKQARNRLKGEHPEGRYLPHPDPKQEAHFFGLLRECVDKGVISESQLREEMAMNHIRHDTLELLDRTPALAA